MGKFRKLNVWHLAKNLAVKVYKVTHEKEFSKDFGLKDQIQRAAVSIASNIAEGDELGTNKLSIRHFYIAKGSSAELLAQIIIAGEIGYVDQSTLKHITNECDKISAMLSKLINSRSISHKTESVI